MSILLHHRRCRVLSITVLLCLLLPLGAMAAHLKSDSESHTGIEDSPFSMLILGDSQMAGYGWEGGYATCILEAYPNAQVFNLAKSGSLLANGDIYAQWELCLSEELPTPDFVLMDGGINDLPHTLREEFQDTGLALVKEAFSFLVEQIHAADPDIHIIYVLMPPLTEWKQSEKGPPSYDVQEYYWKQMNILASSYDYITVLDLFSLNPFRFPCIDCYHEHFADSIHLNEKGYRKTFPYIDNMLVAALTKMLAK